MFDFIDDVIRFFANAIYNLFISIVNAFKDMFLWGFDQLMGFGSDVLGALMAFLQPVDMSQYLSSIPAYVGWMFGQLGLPQCLSLVAVSLAIRLVLQLIPFVRLGS